MVLSIRLLSVDTDSVSGSTSQQEVHNERGYEFLAMIAVPAKPFTGVFLYKQGILPVLAGIWRCSTSISKKSVLLKVPNMKSHALNNAPFSGKATC